MPGKIILYNSPAPKLKNKTRLAVRLSNLLVIPAGKSNEFILKLEADPVFTKLRQAGILRRELPNPARYRLIPLTEIASIGSSVPGFAELLIKHREAVKAIKRIGEDNFRDFFLLDAPPAGSAAPEMTKKEILQVNALVNDIFLAPDTIFPSVLERPEIIAYNKVAGFHGDKEGGFFITYYSLNLARGTYRMDWEKLKRLEKSDFFSAVETEALKSVIARIKTANLYKTTLSRILETITETQREYLDSADTAGIKPLTRKGLANRIGVHPSVVSRALSNRSVTLPWGEEVPLKTFISTNSYLRRGMVREAMEREECGSSAWRISKAISEKYGEYIPARTVNHYKRLLKKSDEE